MIEYNIVEARSSGELMVRVREILIEDIGWELFGGACCAISENEDYRYELWSQTLIRK